MHGLIFEQMRTKERHVGEATARLEEGEVCGNEAQKHAVRRLSTEGESSSTVASGFASIYLAASTTMSD